MRDLDVCSPRLLERPFSREQTYIGQARQHVVHRVVIAKLVAACATPGVLSPRAGLDETQQQTLASVLFSLRQRSEHRFGVLLEGTIQLTHRSIRIEGHQTARAALP